MGNGSREEESFRDWVKRAVLVTLALGLFFLILVSPIGQGLLHVFADWWLQLIVPSR